MFDKVKRYLMAPVRFMASSSVMVNSIISVVVFVVVAVVLDVYVIGNQSLFNTTVGSGGYSITSVVVPLLQVAILIGCILAAVFLIAHLAKGAGSGSK